MAEKNTWERALENILDRVGEIVPKEDEYIGEDGLPYCKHCHTPRAGIVDKEKGLVMYNICRCQAEKKAEEKKREEEQQRRNYVEFLRKNSMLGEFFLGCTFSELTLTKYNSEAVDKARRYCFHAEEMLEKGYGIYISGSCGVGKTTLAACIANRLTEQCHTVWFTSLLEILGAIKSTFDSDNTTDVFERLKKVDFLFLDDVGTEGIRKNDNGWSQATVFDIINRRYNAKKPVIFTSNYAVDSLVDAANFAPRSVQRIAEMGTLKLDIGNINMRLVSQKTGLADLERIIKEEKEGKR